MGQNFEEWRPIAGYEGLYEISSQGRVRSLNYNHTGRTQVLKAGTNTQGYLSVALHKDGKGKWWKVHRLVAQAFLANPNDLPEVNHIDEDKTNNAVSNLEWCTAKDNCNHGTRNARISKPVQQLSLDGVLVAVWPSTNEAARLTGINQGNICSCCNGRPHYYTAGGYIWKYI